MQPPIAPVSSTLASLAGHPAPAAQGACGRRCAHQASHCLPEGPPTTARRSAAAAAARPAAARPAARCLPLLDLQAASVRLLPGKSALAGGSRGGSAACGSGKRAREASCCTEACRHECEVCKLELRRLAATWTEAAAGTAHEWMAQHAGSASRILHCHLVHFNAAKQFTQTSDRGGQRAPRSWPDQSKPWWCGRQQVCGQFAAAGGTKMKVLALPSADPNRSSSTGSVQPSHLPSPR